MALSAVCACADYHLQVTPDASVEPSLDAGTDAGDDAGAGDGGLEPDAGKLGNRYDAGFEVCADVGRTVTLSPLDLFILLDVSGSMDYDYKWVAVKSAMKSFAGSKQFDGLGVGVQYFPLRAQCRTDVYQAPAVPIATLPGNKDSIYFSLDQQRMSGGTPTVPALTGVLAYTQSYLTQFSADAGRKAAIVLATDGVPDDSCVGDEDGGVLVNSIANVELIARGGASSSPSVQTFVIGVGKELGVLDGIAAAGGTKKAVLVDVSANADVQFLTALTQIRKEALGCDFATPPDDPQHPIDRTKVRVGFVPDDNSPDIAVPQVTEQAACGANQGWYYNGETSDGGVDDAGVALDGGVVAPAGSKLILCPATCDAVTSGHTGVLKIEFACGIG
jgi:hypothetical protein